MRIGLIGCGTVGSSLVALLRDEGDLLADRLGEPIEIARIAVRDPERPREGWIDRSLLTGSWREVVSDPEIELVVELVGDVPDALDAIRSALAAGKSVVSANKAVLSRHLAELEEQALLARRDIFFEAAVAGGVPLIRALRVSLFGERLSRIVGIVNGTTNFILTRMQEDEVEFEEALSSARKLGYAEADPTSDLDGSDAAAKAAIMASLAFGRKVTAADVRRTGIEGVSAGDFLFAKRNGWTIKLLAVAEHFGAAPDSPLNVEVFPALVASSHPLAGVRDSFNAVFVEGNAVGELMFFGPGAGGMPTASAVLGDVIEAAHNLRTATRARVVIQEQAHFLTADAILARFSISMEVLDEPGVLARVSEVFGGFGISIARMEQLEVEDGVARLVFLTHRTALDSLERASLELEKLDVVVRLHRSFRVFT